MSEACQVINIEKANTFSDNSTYYRYSPVTGHFETGIENVKKSSNDFYISNPSTSRQADCMNEDILKDPKATQISSSILLEHNYCSYPPTMTTVISSVLVSTVSAASKNRRNFEKRRASANSNSSGNSNLVEAILNSEEPVIDITVPSCSSAGTPLSSHNAALPCCLTPDSEDDGKAVCFLQNAKIEEQSQPPFKGGPIVQEVVAQEQTEDIMCETIEVIAEDADDRQEMDTSPDKHSDREEEDKHREMDPDDDKDKPKTDNKEQTSSEDDGSFTRCICGFEHDDGYMILCDKCMAWQHVDCMEIERNNIPEEYLCEQCDPRYVDKESAVTLQKSKMKHFSAQAASVANTPPSSSEHSNSDGEKSKKLAKNREATKRKKKLMKPVPPLSPKKKKILNVNNKRESLRRTKKDKDDPMSSEEYPMDDSDDLRSWIDIHEEAITNHYSPELRARISALKFSASKTNHKLVGAHLSKPKCKASNLNGSVQKVLMSTVNIPHGHAAIEIRGKYMLPKGGFSPPEKWKEKFIFHHRVTGPGNLATDVQVDTSTFGNNARFVRSSCEPNAEIQHYIEKGALHLYIVSTEDISPKTEVTLPHRLGSSCDFGDKCYLVSSLKKRSRKQSLTERGITKPNFTNNNYYKDLTSKKRTMSTEDNSTSKVMRSTKSTLYDAADSKVTRRRNVPAVRKPAAENKLRHQPKRKSTESQIE